ncbi:MAG TPA: hypothetical protein VGM66_03380 [Candidatus Udaeobacter sp.]
MVDGLGISVATGKREEQINDAESLFGQLPQSLDLIVFGAVSNTTEHLCARFPDVSDYAVQGLFMATIHHHLDPIGGKMACGLRFHSMSL